MVKLRLVFDSKLDFFEIFSSLSLATAATAWQDDFHPSVEFKEIQEGNFTSLQYTLQLPDWVNREGFPQHLRIPSTGQISGPNLYPTLPAKGDRSHVI